MHVLSSQRGKRGGSSLTNSDAAHGAECADDARRQYCGADRTGEPVLHFGRCGRRSRCPMQRLGQATKIVFGGERRHGGHAVPSPR